MELRVLGAHSLAPSTTQPPGLLVDGWLALDAGCIASALALSEQRQVRAVLLTHRHVDHVRDLPLLRLALQDEAALPTLYANADTQTALIEHYLQPLVPGQEGMALRL